MQKSWVVFALASESKNGLRQLICMPSIALRVYDLGRVRVNAKALNH